MLLDSVARLAMCDVGDDEQAQSRKHPKRVEDSESTTANLLTGVGGNTLDSIRT
jgi:hypothetical protein